MPEFQDPNYGLKVVTPGTATNKSNVLILLATPVGQRDEGILPDDFATYLNLDSNPSYNTIALLRAEASASHPTVTVKGHTAAHDGGGGTFDLIATGLTANQKLDIDAHADGRDDDGWHIATANGNLYARRIESINPVQFGVLPYDTIANAAAGSDQITKFQRMINFWRKPTDFNGWNVRNSKLFPPGAYVSHGLIRCHTAPLIALDHSSTSTPNNYQPGPFIMQGSIYIPHDQRVAGFEIRTQKQGGAVTPCPRPYIYLRMYKQRDTGSGLVKWTTYGYPQKAQDQNAYRAWSSGATYYEDEFIVHTHGSGIIYLYMVVGTGAAGVTGPSHTSGTVVNGSISLRCFGSITNSSGRNIDYLLAEETDVGLWINGAWEWQDIHCDVNGFCIGILCCARDKSAVGWATVHMNHSFCNKFQVVCAHWEADHLVDDQTARLALTGLRIGSTAKQIDNSLVYTFNGPLGQESTSGNWSAGVAVDQGWCNENRFYLSSSYPNKFSQGSDDSCYGIVFTSWGSDSAQPTHNRVVGVTVEGAIATDLEEIVHALFYSGSENKIECRVDNSLYHSAASFVPRPLSLKSLTPHINRIEAARTGEYFDESDYQYDFNNGYINIIREAPWDSFQPTFTYEIPDLFLDAAFSSHTRVYMRSISAMRYDSTTPTNYFPYGTTSTNVGNQFNPSDRSFNAVFHAGFALAAQWAENRTRKVMLQLDLGFTQFDVTDNDARITLHIIDPITKVPIDFFNASPQFPRELAGTRTLGSFSQGSAGGLSRMYTGTDRRRTYWLAFDSWVRNVIVRIHGNYLKSISMKLFNAREGRIYSPAHDVSPSFSAYPMIAAKPERGLLVAPAIFSYIDPVGGKKFTRLNFVQNGDVYWATSGLQSGLVPGVNKLWAHNGAAQGSATITQWNGTSWDTIATNARYTEPNATYFEDF